MALSRRELLVSTALSVGSVFLRPSRSGVSLLDRAAGLLDIQPSALERFRSAISGRVILPGDDEYDAARRVWSFNPTTDKRPNIVVRGANREDVVRAVVFAREQSLEVAVRSGGHDVLGASVCEGGMVIDLSEMRRISIMPERRTARVDPGVRSGEFNVAAAQARLVAALGCNPAVGVAGLTLGGGLGWFLGRFGAACDSLVTADIVTANGKILRASATDNSDLYWAVRGGGGNFGIATALEYELHPVDQVLGGVVAYRGADVRPLLRFYRDFMKTAPDELVVELSLFMAKEPTIWALVCWSGELSDGARVLQPLRSFGPPTADTLEVVPYSRLFQRLPPREAPSARPRAADSGATERRIPPSGGVARNIYWRGGTLRELSDDAVEKIAAAAERAPRGWQVGLGHYMHGKICRVPDAETPLTRRAGQLTYFLSMSWEHANDGSGQRAIEWVDQSLAAMRSVSSERAYVNYLSLDSEPAVRATYGTHYQTLSALKQKYDPTNFFHLNRNIRPSGA